MSKNEILGLSYKFLGIYFIANSLSYAITSVESVINITKQTSSLLALTYLGPFVIFFAFGLALYFYGRNIAKIVVKENDIASNTNSSVSYDMIRAIGFSLLGLYFLGNSFPKLASFLVSYFIMPDGFEKNQLLRFSRGIELVVQVAIGLGLFLGSNGVVNLLKALRYSGKKNTGDDSNS